MAGKVAPLPCPAPPHDIAALMAGGARTVKGVLSTFADVEIQTIGRKIPLQAAVAVKLPDRLRIETLSVVGLPEMILTVQGAEARLSLPGKGLFYVGEAAVCLGRILGFPVDPNDFVSFLVGRVPPLGDDCLKPGDADGEPGFMGERWNRTTKEGRVKASLWFAPGRNVLRGVRVFDDGGAPLYTLSFGDSDERGGVLLPMRIVIRAAGVTTVLRYLDPEISEDGGVSFELPPPAGAAVRALEDLGW